MKNLFLAIIFTLPFLSISQNSNALDFPTLMEGLILSSKEQLSEVLKIEPFKTVGEKVYYSMEDVNTTVIKNTSDGSVIFIIQYNEDALKGTLQDFQTKNYKLDSAENKIYVSNSIFFFVITKSDDNELIFMGMEMSKVPK